MPKMQLRTKTVVTSERLSFTLFKWLMVTLVWGGMSVGAPALAHGFEVWLVDQSNSPGVAYGGAIYIYEGADLTSEGAAAVAPASVIDLAHETAALCLATTGANPVRPHMLFFNATHSHAILAFVASGHVVIFDAAARTPLACLRTSAGAGGARQAHAAIPALDNAAILVANQNGKLLERIRTDYVTNTFTLDTAATLDLATCTTPNGVPCEAPDLRPDNAPICPIVESSSTLAFVTLRGGGLFVVDATATPMAILAEYDQATVRPNGCGGVEIAGRMYLSAGGGTATHLFGFDVYQFPLSGYDPAQPPDSPAPVVLLSADDSAQERDAHGMVSTLLGRYLWVADRVANVAEVFEVASGARVNTVDLVGAASGDPAPDLADSSPFGDRLFFSLRGPTPLSGDPHVATGGTPGLGVVQLTAGGKSGELTRVVRISNVDAEGVERADAHAIRVRFK
jgi:hypothetical protein